MAERPAGATLAEPLQPGKTPEMRTSVMVITADTEEEVWEFLRKDIYATSGAWNLDKATLTPV